MKSRLWKEQTVKKRTFEIINRNDIFFTLETLYFDILMRKVYKNHQDCIVEGIFGRSQMKTRIKIFFVLS